MKNHLYFNFLTYNSHLRANRNQIKNDYLRAHSNLMQMASGLVHQMKIDEERMNTKSYLDIIKKQKTLVDKCIYIRRYVSPKSTDIEKIIMNDLHLDKPKNKLCGDGSKNGINYEIKFTGHAKGSKFNFVQLRPDHNIDFYIFVCYNMYHNRGKGKAYILKIPSDHMNKLIVKYGSYAHGSIKKLGKITLENLKNKNHEYAIRCNPNANHNTKQYKIWLILLSYKTKYLPEYF